MKGTSMRREDRRKSIILSAIKVFSKKNYNTATTIDIAREAKIAEGTIYKYFDSKKELFLECTRYIENLIIKQYKALDEQYRDDPIEYLRQAALEYTSFIYDNPTMSKFTLFMLTNTFDEDIFAELKKFIELNFKATHKKILQSSIKGETSKDIEGEAISWFFVGGYLTIVLLSELKISKKECLEIVEKNFKQMFS